MPIPCVTMRGLAQSNDQNLLLFHFTTFYTICSAEEALSLKKNESHSQYGFFSFDYGKSTLCPKDGVVLLGSVERY